MIIKDIIKSVRSSHTSINSLLKSSDDLLKIDCGPDINQQLKDISENIKKSAYKLEFYTEQLEDIIFNTCDYMLCTYSRYN